MLIDSHVHLPGFAAATPEAEDRLYEYLLDSGVDFLIISCLGDWQHRPGPGVPRRANQQAAAFVRRHPDRSRFLAYLDPQHPDWAEELDRARRDGAIGIKLWTSLKDGSGSLKNTDAVLDAATVRKLPVLLHVYNRTDDNLPGEISIREFIELSRRHPEVTMIAAHAGGNWRQSLGMVKRYGSANAFLDLSGGFPENGMAAALAEEDGAERLLYGSDAHGRSSASQIAKLIFSGLTAEAREQIAWRNAARIYRLESVLITNPAMAQKSDLAAKGELWPQADHFTFCGTNPFDPVSGQSPAELAARVDATGMTAYPADLGGLFHLDHLRGNRIWADRCRLLAPRIQPLATLDPTGFNWDAVLDAAAAEKVFAGGWVSPYAHQWQLDDPQYRNFFQQCAGRKMPLWINLDLGDHRFRCRSWSPRPVSQHELLHFLEEAPENDYVFQGLRAGDFEAVLERFGGDKHFRFELSRLTDLTFFLERIVNRFGREQLVFGSETPFRNPEEVAYCGRRDWPETAS